MSRCSQLKLRPTDSQRQELGRLDSNSLPSEPHDVGNWFSSYAYESPDLNTLDGLQDFVESGEAFDGERENGKSGDSQPAGKSDDAFLAASKRSSDEIKFSGSESNKSAAMVTGSSESLSFSSEPPDIKNWFSSYLYESPLVDTIHDFAISDHKEREDDKLCNVQISCRQDKKNAMTIGFCSQSRNPDVVVKCSNSVIGTNMDYQSVCEDVHNATTEKISHPTFSEQRTGNNNHGHIEMCGNTNTHGNDNDLNLHCSSTHKRSPMSVNVENSICRLNGESVQKSIGRINHVKDSLEKEDLHEIVSPGTLDVTTEKRSNRKENESPENGFVSIRKKRSQVSGGSATRRVRVEVESLGNEVEAKMKHEKDSKIGRKVLSEISNVGSTNVQESIGKWRCPQKNKPDIGPPLKQLRLSQWFYRV